MNLLFTVRKLGLLDHGGLGGEGREPVGAVEAAVGDGLGVGRQQDLPERIAQFQLIKGGRPLAQVHVELRPGDVQRGHAAALGAEAGLVIAAGDGFCQDLPLFVVGVARQLSKGIARIEGVAPDPEVLVVEVRPEGGNGSRGGVPPFSSGS